MGIDYKELNNRLCVMYAPAALVEYIFKVQGATWRALNFKAAADELGVDQRTVGRYVRELAKNGIILVKNGELKLAEVIIKQAI